MATPLISSTFASVNSAVPVAIRIIVEIERDRPRWVEPSRNGRLVGDRASDRIGSRLLRSVMFGVPGVTVTGSNVGCGADGVVVGVAVVSGDPIIDTGCCGYVAAAGSRTTDKRFCVGK